MGFDQRSAIVTGASGGIGRATVRRLLQDGAAVMLAGTLATTVSPIVTTRPMRQDHANRSPIRG